MPRVLICTQVPLPPEVQKTALWREDVEREVVATAPETVARALVTSPQLIVIDSGLPDGERLIAAIRANPVTRAVSIAVMSHGDFATSEIELMAAGANAILRLPADTEWDDRLGALMAVAPRRAARLAVTLQFEATEGDGVTTLGGSV